MKYLILPEPKSVTYGNGAFNLVNCAVFVENGLDPRVVRAANELKEKIAQKTGCFHKFAVISSDETGGVYIKKDANIKSEGYVLDVCSDKITVTGGDDAGCFYGIKTLLQILSGADLTVSALTIKDAPDLPYRGFYHDATRGRVPTVEGVKKLVDLIASFKMNSLQLYVEHSFDFAEFRSSDRTEDDYLTAEEMLEIDEYCYNNFIDFIPSLSTFGHLYELLMKPEYQHLCELENFEPESHFWRERMLHHTIDPSNPESFEVVKSLIDQFAPLFRSKYFNICCDETFDLCRGRNEGKDSAQVYIGFVKKIIGHVTQMGKTPMMWSDIALKHPELLPQIPAGTIVLNWNYCADPNTSSVTRIHDMGCTQMVCPGNISWKTLVEFVDKSVSNISQMVRAGFENGVVGMLNTNWGDFGHPAHPECTYYGTVFGAAMSWNVDTQTDDNYNRAVEKFVYQTDKDVHAILLALGAAQRTAGWGQFFEWVSSRKAEAFEAEEKEIESSVKACQKIYSELKDCAGPLYFLGITARGLELFNVAALEIKRNGAVSEAWKQLADIWFADYEKCWLSSAKQSELGEIKKFISKF